MYSWVDPVTVSFRVSEVWKDPRGGTLEVSTSASSASCGYPFKERNRYLVYAEDGMSVGLCTETKPLSTAAPDLKVLGTEEETGDIELPDAPGGVPGSQTFWAAALLLAATTVLMVSA